MIGKSGQKGFSAAGFLFSDGLLDSKHPIIMSVILFRLRGVPDDEADEIRQLLEQNAIQYYETPAGKWGISMEAIWLENEDQLGKAKGLIEDYQRGRMLRVRAEYEKLKREGKAETIIGKIRKQPIRSIVSLAIILFTIYISTMPFIDIGE